MCGPSRKNSVVCMIYLRIRNRSSLKTEPVQATTDKDKLTQIEINYQSAFIRVHLWFKLSFSNCRERLPEF